MALNLPSSTREFIRDMILSKSLTTSQIADAAGCSARSITTIRTNLRQFGDTRAPPIRAGRPRSITPPMLEALCDHLLEKPGLYLDEMALFLALISKKRSKKTSRQKARERNADLRDCYLHNLSEFRSYHLVYIDESGCDKRIGFRRTGWSPLGIAPVQISKFHRDQRYQILPAYSQDGIVMSQVFRGSTDVWVFEDCVEELLQHCGKWPEPRSVLVMDNASFYHSDCIKQMCFDVGVKLMYLPPYLPDLNPIEEFFSELKAFIWRHWVFYEDNPE
ncbi:hypothetical protein N7493_002530 [Penicillium malachiteum]|uniref:Tc1-like transposase DDE domain-containing protein n=1 Tax=Penicillium malachiteum TaxID=1324776 RepID=A0AAD6HS27_9EURO|nr:hypothetical protein N7493_002530 [Penicillium malachiteum]